MLWIPIAGSIFYLFMYLSSWWTLKIQHIGGGHKYIDLQYILSTATCYKEIGGRVFSVTGECSFQYGRTLLNLINFSRLDQIPLTVLGALAISGVLACFFYLIFITRPESLSSQFHIFLYLITPCFWLLFERGNFDWLIFILIFLGVLTLRTRVEILGVILIGISGLLKFYSLPLLLLIPFIMKNRLSRLISIIVFIALLPMTLANISLIKAFPNPLFAAFGSPAPGLWVNFFSWRFSLGFKLSDLTAHIFGLILFALVIILVFRSNRLREKINLVSPHHQGDKIDSFYIVFSASYLICYLAGMSFDYRLIFLVASLILCSKSNPELFGNRTFQILAHSSLWLTFFFFGATGAIPVILAVLGNIAQGLMAVILAYEIILRLNLLHPLVVLKKLVTK
jgi:hypothetical protein